MITDESPAPIGFVESCRFYTNDCSVSPLQKMMHYAKLYMSQAADNAAHSGELSSKLTGEEVMDHRTTVFIADSTEEFCTSLSAVLAHT
jgi:hypothetical protein